MTTKATTAPPAGLITAFTLINREGATAIAAQRAAEQSYEPALAIIDLLHGTHRPGRVFQDTSIENVIEEAAVDRHGRVFDVAEADVRASLMSDTAFDLGFAACWLLMTSLNGRGR